MENQNTGQRPPKSWLLESILTTIFCCLPFGIVGIVFATKVENRFYAGDVTGANQASADAGKWTKIALYAGIAYYVCVLIFIFFMGGAAFLGALNSQP